MPNVFRQIAAQKLADAAVSGPRLEEGWPNRFWFNSDEKHFVSFLHDWSLALPLRIHTLKKGSRIFQRICSEMYDQECEDCNSPSADVARVTSFYAAIVHVHTLEGKTRTIKSGKREGEEIDESPFRVFEVRGGKGGASFGKILDADRGGYLLKKVWEVLKTGTGTDTVYTPPTIAVEEELGSQFIRETDEYRESLARLNPPKGLTQEQLINAYILANYANNAPALKLCDTPSLEEVKKLLEANAPKVAAAAKPSSKLS